MKSLLLNAKLPLDTLFNHYAGGHGPSSDGRTLLLEIDEATKLLKEFKLLKGVTAEGVIAQTDAAAAFNHASKKGPREGGVAHLPRAGTTPRNSPRNPPRNPPRAIAARAILRARPTRRPPAARRLRRVPPPPRDRRPQGRRRAAADERADAPRGAQAAPRVRHRGDEEDGGDPPRRHRRRRQEGGGAEGGGAKGGRSETAHPRRPRARPAAAPAAAAPAAAAKAAAAPAAAAAKRVVAPEARAPARVHNTLDLARASAAGVRGRRRQATARPPPARVVVGARVGSLPYATSPPVATSGRLRSTRAPRRGG